MENKNEEESKLLDAIGHFEDRAHKTIELEKLLESDTFRSKVDIRDMKSVEKRAKEFLLVANARYDSGNISEHELAFYTCYAIENQVHELRWSNGFYDEELQPISNAMNSVEREYGLKDDEFWHLSDAPDEYLQLAAKYDAVLENKLLETFEEFDAPEMAKLYREDKNKFKELRSIGYSSVFTKDENERLLVLAHIYELEAINASKGEAYFAASVMLGSAIETRLIITCINNKSTVKGALQRLGLSNKKLKSKNPLTWKLETLIDVCFEAGWLPRFETERFVYSRHAMANFLRSVRNNVHPAVKLKKQDGLSFGREQYKDVYHIHQLLTSELNWPNKAFKSDS
ncbi:hypothetical protein V9J79_004263 [Vibrio alginolyticus]